MKRNLILLLTLLFSLPSYAEYTGNYSSTISWLKIYNSKVIYFRLKAMPTDHQCQNDYFIISPSLTEKQTDRYYAMLMAAKASGASVVVGYDKDNPTCIYGRPLVHALSF